MPEGNSDQIGLKLRLSPAWPLIVLIIAVLGLSSFTLVSPITQNKGQVEQGTPCETSTPSSADLTTTPDPLELPPPTPEEIGYTDGIIFWSTLLVLILLIGTLREVLHRKGDT